MGFDINLTPFQVFVLAHLTAEDMVRQRQGMAFGRPAPDLGHTLRYRYATSINELTTIVNPDLIPGHTIDADDIIGEIEKEVERLLRRELIIYENEPSHPTFRGNQYEGFYITPKGKAFVRKCFIGLERRVADQNMYETAVEKVETGSTVKKYLKDLRTKLIDKTQDEIIELIMSGVKSYSPAGMAMILQLVGITR